MIIYRVENNLGRGFYHDRFNCNFPIVDYWYPIIKNCNYDAAVFFISNIHPNVSAKLSEMAYSDTSSWVFGFSSKEEMKSWFPAFILADIVKHSGKILKYEVDSQFVIKENKQCIFDISKSKMLGEYTV